MTPYHPPLRPTPSQGTPSVQPRSITPRDVHAVGVAHGAGFPLTSAQVRDQVRGALVEDEAFNDVSTLATVKSDRRVRAAVVARHEGVIAGVALAIEAFSQLDPAVNIRVEAEDGTCVRGSTPVLAITGHARGILSAERTALNFMQHLSGIATLTRRFVQAIEGTRATVLDTRKTLPGWRALEKYAVRMGGGTNHRMDLRSGVLIKDNHLAAIGGDLEAAVAKARQLALPGTPVQVECDTLDQVRRSLDAGVDMILLDNMAIDDLRTAVELCRGRAVTEASGGVTLETVRQIAETGVDRISVGAITHSAPALDLGLDFDGL